MRRQMTRIAGSEYIKNDQIFVLEKGKPPFSEQINIQYMYCLVSGGRSNSFVLAGPETQQN